MDFLNDEIKKCHEEYHRLLNMLEEAVYEAQFNANIFNRGRLTKAKNAAEKKYNDFYLNTYAKVIFEAYKKKKPCLLCVRTGDICSWDDLFKKTFEEIDIRRKNILIGLAEGNGSYKFV